MRKICLLVTCCMLLGLAACGGGDEKVITPNTSEGTQTPGENNSSETQANGYVFTYDGISICVDAEAGAYIEKLGEPASYYESPSCAFDNLDKFYTYYGFEIDTYYLDGKDLVLGIVFLDDTVSTTEGISIGDTKEKVTSVYGAPTQETDNSATYRKDNMKLVFIFNEGNVAAIEYKSLVLDGQ